MKRRSREEDTRRKEQRRNGNNKGYLHVGVMVIGVVLAVCTTTPPFFYRQVWEVATKWLLNPSVELTCERVLEKYVLRNGELEQFLKVGVEVEGFHPSSVSPEHRRLLRELYALHGLWRSEEEKVFLAEEGKKEGKRRMLLKEFLWTWLRASSTIDSLKVGMWTSKCLVEWYPSPSASTTSPKATKASNSTKEFQKLIPRIERTWSFVTNLVHNIRERRTSLPPSLPSPPPNHPKRSSLHTLRILVVGGGPIGLSSAIELLAIGNKEVQVDVLEKRSSYTRDTWFDLSIPPWSPALHLLRSWGSETQLLHHQEYETTETISIRSQMLERFLSKVAMIVGINLRYQMEFVAICDYPSILSSSSSKRRSRRIAVVRNASSSSSSSVRQDWCDTEFLSTLKDLSSSSTPSSPFYYVEFDLLVGSDGASSRVRETTNISFRLQEKFKTTLREQDIEGKQVSEEEFIATIPDLQQVSMIVNFQSVKNRRTSKEDEEKGRTMNQEEMDELTIGRGNQGSLNCPELKLDLETGEAMDPWFPSFKFSGISSVWKRFFHSYCQFQILFNRQLGLDILSQYNKTLTSFLGATAAASASSSSLPPIMEFQRKAYPWNFVRLITNSLLTDQFSNDEAFLQGLQRRKRKRSGKEKGKSQIETELDILLVPIRIYKADNTTLMYTESVKKPFHFLSDASFTPIQAQEGASLSDSDRVSFVLLMGDSSVTAHYRLGVGINNAFLGVLELGDFVKSLVELNSADCLNLELWQSSHYCWSTLRKVVKLKEARARKRLRELVNFQLSAMFFESYCDLVVSYETSKPMTNALLVFDKNLEAGRYEELTPKQVKEECRRKITSNESLL